MLDLMKTVVVYIAVSHGAHTADLASRFVGSWLENPPGYDCELVVACNGGELPLEIEFMFDPLNAKLLLRPNDPGWDLSAYHQIASTTSSELQVNLGESCYFHRSGWLKRIVQMRERHGAGFYGVFSSNLLSAHLNTTAFAITPSLLTSYPCPKNQKERYAEEHGDHSLWRSVKAKGHPVKLVTWDGCYDPWRWREPHDILWRGSQANCLLWCNHVDRYRAANPATQRKWARAADAPFR